jgi:hypothetical protein
MYVIKRNLLCLFLLIFVVCVQGCNDQTRRRRVRTVVRHPARITRNPVPPSSPAAESISGSYELIGSGSDQDTRRFARGTAPRNSSNVSAKLGVVHLCPHLEEFERCDSVSLHCRSTVWQWTTWSPCLLPDSLPSSSSSASKTRDLSDLARCGTGRRVRFAECRRNDGEVVAEEFCRSQLGVGVNQQSRALLLKKA